MTHETMSDPLTTLTALSALRAHTATMERRLDAEPRPEHVSEEAWVEATMLVMECLWASEAAEVGRVLEEARG